MVDGLKPKDPRETLAMLERGVFDAVMALSAAIDHGLLAGFLVAPSTDGAMVELIFPAREGATGDEPNPSRKIEAQTPMAVMAMAGEIANQLLVLEHQNHGTLQKYQDARRENDRLRLTKVQVIIVPGRN